MCHLTLQIQITRRVYKTLFVVIFIFGNKVKYSVLLIVIYLYSSSGLAALVGFRVVPNYDSTSTSSVWYGSIEVPSLNDVVINTDPTRITVGSFSIDPGQTQTWGDETYWNSGSSEFNLRSASLSAAVNGAAVTWANLISHGAYTDSYMAYTQISNASDRVNQTIGSQNIKIYFYEITSIGACEGVNRSITGLYTCTVSAGVTALSYEVLAGKGGNVGGNSGGLGAKVTGTISVTPGQTLYLNVGGNGASVNSFNNSDDATGAGGGGYSSISTSIASNPLVVAGAGGGAGYTAPGGNGGITGPGGGGSGGAENPSSAGSNGGVSNVAGSAGLAGSGSNYSGGAGGNPLNLRKTSNLRLARGPGFGSISTVDS